MGSGAAHPAGVESCDEILCAAGLRRTRSSGTDGCTFLSSRESSIRRRPPVRAPVRTRPLSPPLEHGQQPALWNLPTKSGWQERWRQATAIGMLDAAMVTSRQGAAGPALNKFLLISGVSMPTRLCACGYLIQLVPNPKTAASPQCAHATQGGCSRSRQTVGAGHTDQRQIATCG